VLAETSEKQLCLDTTIVYLVADSDDIRIFRHGESASMSPEKEEQKKRISAKLAELTDYRELTEARRQGLVDDLGRAIEVLDEATDFAKSISPDVISTGPTIQAMEFATRYELLVDSINEAVRFRPMDHRAPAEARNTLLQKVQDKYVDATSALEPVAAVYAVARPGGAIRERLEEVNMAAMEAKLVVADLQHLREVAQQVATEIGIAAHAIVFEKEFRRFTDVGFRWLVASIIVGVGGTIGIFLFMLAHEFPPDPTKAQIWSWGSSKLFLISVFYVTLAFCMRNYSASKHNAAVNKHRANAMQTFELFKDSAASAQTKDAVLRMATEAIFAPQQTGFIKEDIQYPPLRQVTEVLGAPFGKSGSSS
jgi:hypothetical protein